MQYEHKIYFQLTNGNYDENRIRYTALLLHLNNDPFANNTPYENINTNGKQTKIQFFVFNMINN